METNDTCLPGQAIAEPEDVFARLRDHQLRIKRDHPEYFRPRDIELPHQ